MLHCSLCSLVYGMVPFLNAILGTMLPMLSMAKQDNMKWVFSSGRNDLSFRIRFYFKNSFSKINHFCQNPMLFCDYTVFIYFMSLLFQLYVISVTVYLNTWPIWTRHRILQSGKTPSLLKSMPLMKFSLIIGYKAESPR